MEWDVGSKKIPADPNLTTRLTILLRKSFVRITLNNGLQTQEITDLYREKIDGSPLDV